MPAPAKAPKVPKVLIKSRNMLPKYSDAELTALAERVGLTLDELKTLHNAGHQTYQYLGHDLEGGPHTRESIVELVLDCSYMLEACPKMMTPKLREWLDNKASKYDLHHVYEAMAAGFSYPRYE